MVSFCSRKVRDELKRNQLKKVDWVLDEATVQWDGTT